MKMFSFMEIHFSVKGIGFQEVAKYKGFDFTNDECRLFLKKYTDLSQKDIAAMEERFNVNIGYSHLNEEYKFLINTILDAHSCEEEEDCNKVMGGFFTTMMSRPKHFKLMAALTNVGYKFSELKEMSEKDVLELFLFEGWARRKDYDFSPVLETLFSDAGDEYKNKVDFYKRLLTQGSEQKPGTGVNQEVYDGYNDTPEEIINSLEGDLG